MQKKKSFFELPKGKLKRDVLSDTTTDTYTSEILPHKNNIECLELCSINGTSSKCKSNTYVGCSKKYSDLFHTYSFESRINEVTNIDDFKHHVNDWNYDRICHQISKLSSSLLNKYTELQQYCIHNSHGVLPVSIKYDNQFNYFLSSLCYHYMFLSQFFLDRNKHIECPLKFCTSSMWSIWFGVEYVLYTSKKCLKKKSFNYNQFRLHLNEKKDKFHVILRLFVEFIDTIILKGEDPIDINVI